MEIQAVILIFHQNQELLKLYIVFQFYAQFLNGSNFGFIVIILTLVFDTPIDILYMYIIVLLLKHNN